MEITAVKKFQIFVLVILCVAVYVTQDLNSQLHLFTNSELNQLMIVKVYAALKLLLAAWLGLILASYLPSIIASVVKKFGSVPSYKYEVFGLVIVATIITTISAFALGTDFSIQALGTKASNPEHGSFKTWLSVSAVFNIAIFFSTAIRILGGFKRATFNIIALPVIFLISFFLTLNNSSALVGQQAKIISQAQEDKARRDAIAEALTANALRQTKINHVSNSSKSLELASANADKAEEISEMTSSVSRIEAAAVPLEFINALLPDGYQMTVNQYLTSFYILLSLGLILIGYFFSDMALSLYGQAIKVSRQRGVCPGQDSDMSGTSSDTSGQVSDKARQLSDKEITTAINEKLQSRPKTEAKEISRKWIADACRTKYGVARQGTYLDNFIPGTKRKINGWFKLKAS